MPVFANTRFQGELRTGDQVDPVDFDASIDDDGVLHLDFEPICGGGGRAYLFRMDDESGRRLAWRTLTGQSADAITFASDSFGISQLSHATSEGGSVIRLGGVCAQAQISTTLAEPAANSQLSWRLRRFRSFNWLQYDLDLGRVAMGGVLEPERPQQLSAALVIERVGVADSAWFDQAEERLAHIARVMSFAAGSYLRPYAVQRIAGDQAVLHVYRRSDTAEPFLPPFSHLNLEPIYRAACGADAGARARFAELDPAIGWLLAPGYYDEIRLTAAMTALENLIDQAFPDEMALFVKPGLFKKLAKTLRKLIDDEQLPEGMKRKAPELNRRPFEDKLTAYLAEQRIPINDLPETSLKAMIQARNEVVHRGIYFDPEIENQPDLWEHLLVARELVTRILLEALGFVGNYFSPYHGPNQQLRFPSCRPLTDAEGRELLDKP